MEKLKRGLDLTMDLDSVDIVAHLPFGRDVRAKVTAANLKTGSFKFPEPGASFESALVSEDTEEIPLGKMKGMEDVAVKRGASA